MFAVSVLLLALFIGLAEPAAGSGDQVLGPLPVFRPDAGAYPSDWRVRGFEGLVRVVVDVDSTGKVSAARVKEPGFADTDSAAVRTARRWKFQYYRDERGYPRTGTLVLSIAFEHPRSPDLLPPELRRSRGFGKYIDTSGEEQSASATVTCSATVDSVTGLYDYTYNLTNESRDSARIFYLAIFPLDLAVCAKIAGIPVATRWSGFQGCSGHIDVAGWMATVADSAADPRGNALAPGASIRGFKFTSADPPGPGRWVAGSGNGCGSECFPWAAKCDLTDPVAGVTSAPLTRSVGFLTVLSGEVYDSTQGFIPGAKIQILGTGLSASAESGFNIQGVPLGKFRVRATAPNHVPEERWLDMERYVTYVTMELRPLPVPNK